MMKNFFANSIYIIALSICISIFSCKSSTKKPDNKSAKNYIQFKLVDTSSNSDSKKYINWKTKKYLRLNNKAVLDKSDIHHIKIDSDLYGRYFLYIKFNRIGMEKLSKVSKIHLKKRIGLLINNQLIAAPKIMEEIKDGKIIISANFTKREAEKIAEIIENR